MIAYFSDKISFKRFKKLNEGTSGDIVPQHFDEILWKALRNHELYIGVDTNNPEDPVFVSVRKPKGKVGIIK